MRVTNNMITGRVVFNMQRSLQRFFNLETQMSSGRQINKPSDNPSGTLRDLDYRTELSNIAQYRDNISQGLSWSGTYDQVLSDAKNFLSSAKEVAIAMSNDTYDQTAREASASEIESIFDQVLSLTNTRLEGRSMFAGWNTQQTAFAKAGRGVTYQGNDGQIDIEVDNGQRLALNLDGASVFMQQLGAIGENADVNIGLALTTNLSDLHSGAGIDQTVGTFTFTDLNRNITSTVDISGATTVDDVLTAINTQLTADGITNVTAVLGNDGNNITIDTTPNGQIGPDTRLAWLNDGSGIEVQPGTFRVSNSSGVDVSVDISSAVTINDVITLFNQAMDTAAAGTPPIPGLENVTISINAAGTGFQIDDPNGTPFDLVIDDPSGESLTAQNLGINGSVGAQLIGQDLNPTVAFEIGETTGTTAADLGILGRIYTDKTGSDLDPSLTATALLSEFNNRNGVEFNQIEIWQGNTNLAVDLSDPTLVTVQDLIDRINSSVLDVTATINPDGTGIQIINNDPYQSLTVEDIGNGQTAKDLGLYGSSDMMGSLSLLANALRNDDREATSMLLEGLDQAINVLLDARGTVGSRAIRMETTDARLVDNDLNFTRLLSDVEDADMTEVLTKLATYETNYQAALNASARIIQPTLLDFLNG
jgi:flagellar hook-associated protein 3 FlgL